MIGEVERYLLNKIKEDGAIHMTLIDPEDVTPRSASTTAREAEECQSSAIMIGGTTLVSTMHLDKVVKAVKSVVEIPVILFPNNITGISKYADAIWFMSLLNSSDPYFIAGAQVLGAPLVRKLGLEPIPMGYIIVGEAGAVGVIGRACSIPHNKPELAASYALAAQYLGMRFVYLEAGSGAKQAVSKEMIRAVKNVLEVPLIVGGGIRTGQHAKEAVAAGADIVVTGTVLEESSSRKEIKERIMRIIEGIKEGVNRRYRR
ncbi:MAG: geranylgeranylglyceryl phosphate synthase [Candidatus Bathyarchaeota archaeon B26-2]|nr:MAG: geranylgeranylglyceryl phosphate synthase [Candidatus Bathyarchaeota archaeon B26-2]